jgi:hypothetical protein
VVVAVATLDTVSMMHPIGTVNDDDDATIHRLDSVIVVVLMLLDMMNFDVYLPTKI